MQALFVDHKVQVASEQQELGNYRKAVANLNEAAQQGSSIAQVTLASLYKLNCRQIMDEIQEANGKQGRTTSPSEVYTDPIGYLDELTEEFSDMVAEVAARWIDGAVNVVNGVLQRNAIDHSEVIALLRLDPFCSTRAIENLVRAADQDQRSSDVELGDMLYFSGTGGGIGGHYAVLSDIRDNANAQAHLHSASYYYRKAIAAGSARVSQRLACVVLLCIVNIIICHIRCVV